jgi:L-seryl-tRNA(Ser) seleniumtransferase
MLTMPLAELRRRSEHVAQKLHELPGLKAVAVRDDTAFAGGGSLPDQPLPTVVLALEATELGPDELANRLRTGEPAVIGRVHEGEYLLDLRTVFESQEEELVAAVGAATASRSAPQ